jgi:hypothetical protein
MDCALTLPFLWSVTLMVDSCWLCCWLFSMLSSAWLRLFIVVEVVVLLLMEFSSKIL